MCSVVFPFCTQFLWFFCVFCIVENLPLYNKTLVQDSGVTGGGQGEPIETLIGKFLLFWEKRGNGAEKKEKGKLKKGRKRKVDIWKLKEEKLLKEERTFFFFFAFHFSKWLKFVLGLPKWEFSTRKKIRKNYFAPLEKYACYAPGSRRYMTYAGWDTNSLKCNYYTTSECLSSGLTIVKNLKSRFIKIYRLEADVYIFIYFLHDYTE